MEERVGAYIIDTEGNLIPDLSDEAMAARQKPEIRSTKSEIEEEVNKDA